MKLRSVAILALISFALAGCKKRMPPVGPEPMDDAAGMGAAGGARADSLEAERVRLERERMAREAAAARIRESLTEPIYFAYDSDEFDEDTQQRLRNKAAILRANPDVQIRIEGHADARGSTEYNLALGQRRAEAVRDFFAGFGIDGDRITTVSYGKERPAVEGDSDYAYSQNRRDEFEVIAGELRVSPAELR